MATQTELDAARAALHDLMMGKRVATVNAWNPQSESADAALLPNFARGNARADDLVRNNGYAANAVQLHQDHIVGSFFRLSYCPSWRYLGIKEEESRAFAREVEAAWYE